MIVKYWASIAGYVTVSMPFILKSPHAANLTTAEITRDYVFTSLYIGALGSAIGDLVLVGNKLSDLAGYAYPPPHPRKHEGLSVSEVSEVPWV